MSVTEFPLLTLPDRYLQIVQDVLSAHIPDAEVWAYGSRVNGDCFEASDLDLVVRQPDDLRRRQSNLYEVKEAFTESNLPINWSIGRASLLNSILKLPRNMSLYKLPRRRLIRKRLGGLGYEF